MKLKDILKENSSLNRYIVLHDVYIEYYVYNKPEFADNDGYGRVDESHTWEEAFADFEKRPDGEHFRIDESDINATVQIAITGITSRIQLKLLQRVITHLDEYEYDEDNVEKSDNDIKLNQLIHNIVVDVLEEEIKNQKIEIKDFVTQECLYKIAANYDKVWLPFKICIVSYGTSEAGSTIHDSSYGGKVFGSITIQDFLQHVAAFI